MKKILLVLVIILFITKLNVFAATEFGKAEIEWDKLYPDRIIKDADGNYIVKDDAFKASRSALPRTDRIYSPDKNFNKYITYYKDQFALDYETSWLGLDGDEILNSNANVMFSIQQSVVESMIFLVDQVYNFKVYNVFKSLIDKIIKSMYENNSNIFISIILAMLGFYFAYKMITNQKADFWSSIIKVILVLSFSLLFFNKPNLILSNIDYVMNNVSNGILDLKQSALMQEKDHKETNWDGSTQIANLLWDQYVVKPWKFLEFGDLKMADKHGDEILAMSPGSDERIDKLNEIFKKEDVNTKNISCDRLSFVCMYFIPFTANIIMISMMCILIIGYQFLAIIIFVLGSFVMILALLPNGTNLLKVWASKVIGFSAMKVLLTFLFTILLAVNEIIFDNVESDGWIATLLVQLLFYIIIFIKRNAIISMFGTLQAEFSNPYMTLNKLKRIKDFPFMNNYNWPKGNHGFKRMNRHNTNNHYNNYYYNVDQDGKPNSTNDNQPNKEIKTLSPPNNGHTKIKGTKNINKPTKAKIRNTKINQNLKSKKPLKNKEISPNIKDNMPKPTKKPFKITKYPVIKRPFRNGGKQ